MAVSKNPSLAVYPPSGGLIGIPAHGNIIQVRAAGDGTLPLTNTAINATRIKCQNANTLTVWYLYVHGSLTNLVVSINYYGDSSVNPCQSRNWLYNATSNLWDINGLEGYDLLAVDQRSLLTFPTYGATELNIMHNGAGVVTSSSADVFYSLGWSMHPGMQSKNVVS